MQIGHETTNGESTCIYLGNVGAFAVFVNVSPVPKTPITRWNSFQPEIDILLAPVKNPDHVIALIDLNKVVDGALGEGLETDNGLKNGCVTLSPEQCAEIDEKTWEYLGERFKLAPRKLLTVLSTTSEVSP